MTPAHMLDAAELHRIAALPSPGEDRVLGISDKQGIPPNAEYVAALERKIVGLCNENSQLVNRMAALRGSVFLRDLLIALLLVVLLLVAAR